MMNGAAIFGTVCDHHWVRVVEHTIITNKERCTRCKQVRKRTDDGIIQQVPLLVITVGCYDRRHEGCTRKSCTCPCHKAVADAATH